METVTIWQIITGVFIPVVIGGFWLLHSQNSTLKADFTKMIDTIKADFDQAVEHAKNNATMGLSGAMSRLDKDGSEQWQHINETKKELSDFKLFAEQRYARDSDVKSLIDKIERQMVSISEKLDHLADTRRTSSKT